MTVMAPEAPPAAATAPPAAAGRSKNGNVFTRHIGPLPMWAWLLISLGLIGVYYVWHRNQAAQQASPSMATGTDASQVPQFVNQTYTSVTPPAAPTPAPTPAPPAGHPPRTCPKGQAWDPDEKRCVPEADVKHKRHHERHTKPHHRVHHHG